MRPTSARISARPTTATRNRQGCQNELPGVTTRVTVGVRIRPSNAFDPDMGKVVVAPDPMCATQICVDDGKRGRMFAFDHVFTASQEEVYAALGQPMLEEAYKGFNVCLFAYGQTGSGKTHSIQGTAADEGLVPRFVREMFRAAQEKVEADPDLTVKVTMSYLEIYMEKVRDLLVPRVKGQEPESLELIDVKGRVVARGASVHSVLGSDRVAELLCLGNGNRQVAETKMNEVSSRSHSIVQFTLSQLHESVDRRDTESTVTIVDLAGSERQGKTESTGVQFEEAKKINQSLLVLGRALNSFSDSRGDMVSLRDSKLTRLLSECFGGNAKTWMLATVAPTAFNVTESLSTLEYATHAKNITNKVFVNAVERRAQLAELRDIVNKLASTVEFEQTELDATEAEIVELERSNLEISNTVAAHRAASGPQSDLERLVQLERQVAEELMRDIRELESASSFHVRNNNKRVKSRSYFGWMSLGLQEVLSSKDRGDSIPFTRTLDSLSGMAGASLSGALRLLHEDDKFLRWQVVIDEAYDLPLSSGSVVQLRVSFLIDPDCAFEVSTTLRNGRAIFSFDKKFYIPVISAAVENWYRSRDLMRVELSAN